MVSAVADDDRVFKALADPTRRFLLDLLFTRDGRTLGELEAELSGAIARIRAGEFVPTPSDYACAGCPALDLVCAGPRLRTAHAPPEPVTA